MNGVTQRGTDPTGGGTTLSHVPLETFRFNFGGRSWAVRAARDHAALLDISERFAEFPFGLLLWESAPVLAEALAARAGLVRGARVLELGCGVGLPGIVARWLGAAAVRQTDHISEALELCRVNAAGNGVAGIETVLADWTRWGDDTLWDFVIGSDVLYDRVAHQPFAAVLARNLAPGGRVLLADPGRQDTPLFLAAIERDGWRIATSRHATPALLPGGADIATIDVIELTR